MDIHRPAIPPLEPKKSSRDPHVRIPTYAVYIAITVAMGLGIVLWTVAFQVGRNAGKNATLQRLGLTADPLPPRTDPIDELLGDTPRDPTHVLASNDATPDVTPPDPPAYILATGPIPSDPRRNETNYLKLASGLSQDEATRAIEFLATNAMPALGLRVDSGGSDANNPARYDLFALEPVQSSRFGELKDLRQSMVREAARLGQIWKKPPNRGTVDFAQSIWVKHTSN